MQDVCFLPRQPVVAQEQDNCRHAEACEQTHPETPHAFKSCECRNLNPAESFSKVGVMLRESLDPEGVTVSYFEFTGMSRCSRSVLTLVIDLDLRFVRATEKVPGVVPPSALEETSKHQNRLPAA